MAKSYAPGGPIESVRRRLQDRGDSEALLLECLEKLDSYYRERLDGYAVKVTQLEDELRRGGGSRYK
jgi:hypothetical protein|tara:strand:- start:2229 stop:2429 length:201 start_codon:yes stop_codon:yes gene_type:complete